MNTSILNLFFVFFLSQWVLENYSDTKILMDIAFLIHSLQKLQFFRFQESKDKCSNIHMQAANTYEHPLLLRKALQDLLLILSRYLLFQKRINTFWTFECVNTQGAEVKDDLL